MVAGVINNATNTVKICTTCIDNKDDITLPYLGETEYANVIIVGQGSSADAILTQCTQTSRYLLVCIWPISAQSGEPNSWVVFDLNDLTAVKSSLNTFTASLGGSFNAGYLITIRPGPGGGGWWLYILFVIVILAMAGVGLYYGIKVVEKKKPIYVL